MHCIKNLARVRIWGQRSEVKVVREKTRLVLPTPLGAYEWYALAANNVQQQRMGPFRGCQGVFSGVVRQFYAGGKITACCLVFITVF